MIRTKVIVTNETGLHLRPAGKLCEAAGRFSASLKIVHGGVTTDAKSVLSVLAAGIGQGEEIELIADGEDEEEASQVIVQMFRDRFES